MRAKLAALLRKLADWLSPAQQSPQVQAKSGGPGNTPPPPEDDGKGS